MCERTQRFRPLAERRQRIDRLTVQQPHSLLRGRDADDGRMGGLCALAVGSGRLAQRRRIAESHRADRPGSGRPGRRRWQSGRARRSSRASRGGTQAAAISTLARITAPVLRACMSSTCAMSSCLPLTARSIAWPPAMPKVPLAWASRSISRSRIAGEAGSCGSRASSWNASGCSASPTSTAVASSKALWQVGRPRRRSSSSMAGRSSCTSE